MLPSTEVDITSRLTSVQFESALNESQLSDIFLRNKSHALLYYACSQTIFFVNALNELRDNRYLVLNPGDKKLSNKLLKDLKVREPLLIGIIGYGRLGSTLASFILKNGSVIPEELRISTRRPECADALSSKGVFVCYDNENVASSVHIVFLCCSPSSIPFVAAELKGKISPRTILYSFVSGFKTKKLKQLFDHEAIICPQYFCNKQLYKQWNPTSDIKELLGNLEAVLKACPIQHKQEDMFLRTNGKLFTLWIFTAANMCTVRGHTIEETLKILDHLFFKNAVRTKKQEVEEIDESLLVPFVPTLSKEDLIHGLEESDRYFPVFDIGDIGQQLTFLDQKLADDADLCKLITHHYSQIMQALYYKLLF